MRVKLFSQTRWRWTFLLAIVAIIPTVVMTTAYVQPFGAIAQKTVENVPESVPTARTVTALGRLVPQGEVITLSASPSVEGTRIAELLVQEGDKVEEGELIAILDSRDRLEAALTRARQQVTVAQARLKKVQAGAKLGEIAAQKAVIARLEREIATANNATEATVKRLQAELGNAQTDYRRFDYLYREGAIADAERDLKRMRVETTTAQLEEAIAQGNRTLASLQEQLVEAKATLDQIREVRPVDVEVAQAEVDEAVAAVEQAQANLELAFVRSPQPGQVLKIQARPGEIIDDEGIIELGQTAQMEVIAEVYQTDIGRVNLGKSATITSQVFTGKLQGEVTRIGTQIDRQNTFANESGADVDRRIVEVRIRLNAEASQKVENLTNLQVQVEIET